MAKRVSIETVNKKLDKLLKGQKKLEDQLRKELRAETKELEELEALRILERNIQKEVEPHPLLKLTYRDLIKGTIGAFIGVLAHYTFIYGVEIAHEISILRAALLFPLAFIIGGAFLYLAGFRKVKDPKVLWFFPIRLIVMYLIALVMAVLVLFFFQPEFGHHFEESFKQVATVMLLGLIGAVTADLVGH